MNITKSTHTGHCQACGRVQAVMVGGTDNGKVAKHGYKVDFGYFQGVCPGANHLPLQQERVYTDQIIAAMEDLAARNEFRVQNLKNGSVTPETIETKEAEIEDGKIKRDLFGNRVYKKIPFAQGTDLQKSDAINKEIFWAEQNARDARAHARSLEQLAAKVHGTALISIKKEPKVAPVAPTVDVKKGVVTGTYATKAARQADLDKVQRAYEKAHKQIQKMFLDCKDVNVRDSKEANDLVYYGPMYLNHWRPKHAAATLKFFPLAAELVADINALYAAREAIRKA